jgi:enoyl-CoA hydratase
VKLAKEIAAFPQGCLRSDRRSSYDQWSLDMHDALANEAALGIDVIRSGETLAGAARFASGEGRHGSGV